jgi:hypothetical protein
MIVGRDGRRAVREKNQLARPAAVALPLQLECDAVGEIFT